MRNFCFIRRKRNRFVISMSNYLWIALMFTFLFLMIVAVYDDDDERGDITVIQNREILEEKQGLRSREEELLELAAKLEMDLLQHQERIKLRLETLNARKKGMDGGRELDSRHHHHHQHLLDEGRVEGNEHRLKRRLMDAQSSQGPGRHHGHGKSGSSGAITRDDQTIPGVKASKSNKTRATSRNAAKSRSMKRADISDAKALRRTPHNENKKKSYYDDNEEIILYQSASTLSMEKHLAPGHHHKSKKAINETKGSRDKHFEKSSDLKNVQSHQHDQSWDNSRNGLSESDFISTNPVAATTTLNQPSNEADTNAALILDEPYLGCEDLAHVNSRELVGSGYTKRVERVELRDGRWVAVKSVRTEGNDVAACLERGMAKRDCIQLANYKLLKETALLHQLRHPNIVKLLGFCVKGEDPFKGSGDRTPSSLTIVERGTPLTFINLLQMTWEDRLRVCLGISRLMVYLSESPLGSLAIHDYKLSQFITVDGEIKLADLDDVDNNHSPCSTSSECSIDMGTNITLYTPCSNEVCSNFSQKSNMAHSYLKFFVFLQLEQPPGMSELIGQFINNTKKILWSPRQCLQHMQTILSYYKQGKYVDQGYTSNINDSNFRVYYDHTADQGEEYWCPGTRQLAATCVLSVYDENEAITICLRDRQCVAFVLTPERTWTGRYIAHFKKAISMMSIRPSKGNTIFVFPTL